MNKRIKEKFDSWDLRSLLLTLLFFAIGIFLFFFLTDIRDRFRADKKEQFNGHTTGVIILVEPVKIIRQSKWKGTRIYVDNYKVSYRYRINGQLFERIDIIPVTTKNQRLIEKILERGTNDNCFVKFDIEDPGNSILIENE